MDFRSQSIGPERNLTTGERVDDGGFNVTLKLNDLSNAALNQATSATKSGSLLWIFRFVNGYQASAASARWSPNGGFSFGFNDYTTGSTECGSDGEKCQLYPGDQDLKGLRRPEGRNDHAPGPPRVPDGPQRLDRSGPASDPRQGERGDSLLRRHGVLAREHLTEADDAVIPLPDRQPARDGLPAPRGPEGPRSGWRRRWWRRRRRWQELLEQDRRHDQERHAEGNQGVRPDRRSQGQRQDQGWWWR